MYHLRISKYDYRDRNELGHYLKDDWTAISDIGKTFNGVLLTPETYYETEDKYIQVLKEACELFEENMCKLVDLENYDIKDGDLEFNLREGMKLNQTQFLFILRLMLREKFWARIIGSHIRVTVGYDYYMHITADSKKSELKKIINQNGLFWENRREAY